ncbi:MAG TPA: carboxypeptidase regulatory-like domain-containing protein [Bryobacteraceae bacterium]|nr:carboxypeptidase regulatory-like domain-containing protein [Bryobacteraceae bacterium]
MSRRVTLLSLFLLGTPLAFSQGFGTIVGTVTDPSGSAIANAKVTATESGTGVSREAVTNNVGAYVIPGLRPTTYVVTVEAPGFTKYSQPNVALTADQSETVKVELSIGQANQQVTVETAAVQTDTYTSTLKEVVDSQRIIDLPLNGRNAATLTTLVPGAISAPNGGADQGQTKTFPGAIEVSANGSQQNMVAYNLDGADNVDRYTNTNNPFPFPDALQEFSFLTSNYSAEYGEDGGGVVNVITRSGTNEFHGDFFGFIRNGDVNSRNYFASAVDPLKRWQEGGTIGGPIVKNKTFFFAGFQATTLRDVTNGLNKDVPTPAEETGNFSGVSGVLYDPTTQQPFAGNQIPLSRFDPASLGVMKYLPQSSAASGIVFYSSPLHQNFYDVVGRLDQNFSDKDHVGVRYDWELFTNKPVYQPTNILSYADGSDIVDQNILLQWTHVFSPTLLNEFRVGFLRDASIRGPAPDVPSVRTFGVNIPYQPPANDVQTINVSGFFSFGDNPFARFTRNNFIGNDALRLVKGHHNISMGVDFERRQVELDNGFNSPGLFTFNGQSNHALSTGNSMGDFVLGDLYQFQQAQGQFEDANAPLLGFFVQDDWKVGQRLTINMGLRWEPYFPYHEVDARVEGFSLPNYNAGIVSSIYTNAPPGLLFRGDKGFPTNGTEDNFRDFDPRLGFAWDVFGDSRTSLRGGIGTFYDSATNGIFNNNMVDEAPFAQQILLTNPPGPFSNPLDNLPQYTSVFPVPYPIPHNIVLPPPVSVTTFNLAGRLAFENPVMYSWNLTMEHQFGGNWLGRVAYVGSHSTHLSLSENFNPSIYIPGSTLSEQQRVLFPQYSNIELIDQSGNANYNSLQATAQKRLSHGFSILANFTWQKSIDNVPPSSGGTGYGATGGDGGEPLPWYARGNDQLDYGTSDFNRQRVFVLSYLWDIPSPAPGNKFVNGVLGNWELSGVMTAETGLPFTIFAGKDISQTGLNADRAVYVGGDPIGPGACKTAPCENYVNPAAFAYPAAGTVGNVGKDALTGPGLFDWDMGVFKNIPITERWRIQFRAEFFNTLNHTNFTSNQVGGVGASSSNNYPTLTFNSSTFGTITSAYDPRILQFALKVFF